MYLTIKALCFLVLGVLVLSTVTTAASSLKSDRYFPESIAEVPISSQWKKLEASVKRLYTVTPREMQVTIALKHRNRKWLQETLLKVSDPDSSQYGHHLTFEQIDSMISPHEEHVKAVKEWVLKKGAKIVRSTKSQDFIIIRAPVNTIADMFQCDIQAFEHVETGKIIFRSDNYDYSIPKHLSSAIAFVGDLVRFPKLKASQMKNESKASASKSITPDVIRQSYNITSHPVKNVAKGNTQAIASFLEQYVGQNDLDLFIRHFNVTKAPIKFVGPNPMNNPGIEANLDIQYITAVAEGVPTWAVSTAALHDGQEDFLQWIVSMSQMDNSPWVHSVSYGDIEDSISLEYVNRVEDEFMKFGISGRTILFASGDSGTGCNKERTTFVPNWPASSPSVTAVGATKLTLNEGEVAWQYSGGGFSNYFTAPQYQKEAIAKYWTNKNLPDKSYYNATGRAYPDVAAFGVDFQIYYKGLAQLVSGTSASTPTFAGVVTLLNNARMLAGKRPLGFLNPAIYKKWAQIPGAFKDITVGRNFDDGECPGFPATPGFDPVTGFGVPNVDLLTKLAQYL